MKITRDGESVSQSIIKIHVGALFFQLLTISGIDLICLVCAICFLPKFSVIRLLTHQKVLTTALKVKKVGVVASFWLSIPRLVSTEQCIKIAA